MVMLMVMVMSIMTTAADNLLQNGPEKRAIPFATGIQEMMEKSVLLCSLTSSSFGRFFAMRVPRNSNLLQGAR